MQLEGYRNGVGMVILNQNKKIFIGQRFDKDESAWQMPQGGIDKNENPHDACIRELTEETGIYKNFKIIYKTKNWYSYDLPKNLQKKLWRGKYKGQIQQWFLIDFFGEDGEFTQWGGRRGITDGHRPGAEPAGSADHTDFTPAEIENNPG